MDQDVPQKIGKYEILAELGRSALGAVYLARDPSAERKVALKTVKPELVMSPEILERLFAEVRSAAALQHGNLAAIFEVGEDDGRPFIAMEMVEGETLQSIINLRAHLPLAAKLKLIQQACEGLGFAHRHGVIHRDVKPANILVTHHGVVKIVDFGMAHLESNLLSKTGKFLGTIHYAAPEQINDGQVDQRADVWALTAVTYEFIAYRKPFEGSNIASTIGKILTSQPEPLSVCCPGVTAELDPIMAKGLAKVPDDRYSTLEELLKDLGPVALHLQQSLMGELIGEAKALRDRGDLIAARQKLRATLILDQTHSEANGLLGEIQSEIDQQASSGTAQGGTADSKTRASVASSPSEGTLKAALERVDGFVEAGDYLGARDQLQKLQHEHGDSNEIRLKLEILEPFIRTASLVEEARKAMSHQEYGEAIRLLNSALALNPRDSSAADLKVAASRERDHLRQVREALSAGQKAMREGDSQTAAVELKRLLELDPAHVEGASLLSQLQSSPAAGRPESKLSDGLQQVDRLLAEKKFEDAEYVLIELQHEHPESSVVGDKLQTLQSQMKRLLLVRDGEQALEHGEFGEAVRILTEAQQLEPSDEHIRQLKVRAVESRDRLRQVRESISSGQRALRDGELEIAEKQFGRALELDSKNAQAERLLAQAKAERAAHARDEVLQSGIKLAEGLISANKLDEAERNLAELQKDFRNSKPLEALLETLKQKKLEAAAAVPPKPPRPAFDKRPVVQATPASEYTRSMELAEELRRSLKNLKPVSLRPAAPRPSTKDSGSQPSVPPAPVAVQPALPPGDASDATLVRGANPANPPALLSAPEPNATIASTPSLASSGLRKDAPAPKATQPESDVEDA